VDRKKSVATKETEENGGVPHNHLVYDLPLQTYVTKYSSSFMVIKVKSTHMSHTYTNPLTINH